MLGFESQLRYALSIHSDLRIGDTLTITLFNSNKRIMPTSQTSDYSWVYDCPEGIYILRVEINHVFNDTYIQLDGNKYYNISRDNYSNPNVIPLPLHYSSALLGYNNTIEYKTSHEYYTGDAYTLSTGDTTELHVEPNEYHTTGSLFIFLRFPSVDQYHMLKKHWPNLFIENFKLLNSENKVIAEFSDPNIYGNKDDKSNFLKGFGIDGTYNDNYGSFAINVTLPAGTYYLLYEGTEVRQCVLSVYENLHTQVFLTLGKTPLFGSMRIFLAKNRRFEPDDSANILVDTLLDKLQNREYSIDLNILNDINNKVYDSPILTILSLYLYFLGKQKDANEIVYLLLLNLNAYFNFNVESSDFRILEILYSKNIDNLYLKKAPIIDPPLFRIGYEILIKESLSDGKLIQANSINDLISENLLYDSPFTSFTPVKKTTEQSIKISDFGNDSFSMESTPTPSYIKNMIMGSGDIPDNAIDQSLIDNFQTDLKKVLSKDFIKKIHDESTQTSWVKVAVSDHLKSGKETNIDMLSTELALPATSIKRILQQWSKE
ncbi:hypothetical protein ACFSKL_02895 [Belliella marina]|uniref:Uncharacterized protein n=1 Tax=Belliella marina TaxID=1644146 RepID=A0ABW4VKC8_9BACT